MQRGPFIPLVASAPGDRTLTGWRLYMLGQAIREIHCPSDLQSAERARQRLAFDELLFLQLMLLLRREILRCGFGSAPCVLACPPPVCATV